MKQCYRNAYELLADTIVEFNAAKGAEKDQFGEAIKAWKWSGSEIEDDAPATRRDVSAWYETYNF